MRTRGYHEIILRPRMVITYEDYHMSCMPAKYDFAIYEGDNCLKYFTYTDDMDNPVDLTGATIKLTAKEDITQSTSFVESNGVIDDAATGEFHIPFIPSQTKGLISHKEKTLSYDIQVTQSDGKIHTLLFGNLKIYPEVTQ